MILYIICNLYQSENIYTRHVHSTSDKDTRATTHLSHTIYQIHHHSPFLWQHSLVACWQRIKAKDLILKLGELEDTYVKRYSDCNHWAISPQFRFWISLGFERKIFKKTCDGTCIVSDFYRLKNSSGRLDSAYSMLLKAGTKTIGRFCSNGAGSSALALVTITCL